MSSPARPRPPSRQFHDRRATPRPGGLFSGEAYLSWHRSLRRHWLEYLIEASFLASFVLASAGIATVLDAPALRESVPEPWKRRVLAGLGTALVAIALIYSPWGRRSGTHLNPAMTLAFFRLRKVGRWDLLFYVLAQFAGGAAGIAAARAWMAPAVAAAGADAHGLLDAGPGGLALAFALELALSAGAMLVILLTINHTALYRWAGAIYAALLAVYVAALSPLSALGTNPARTVVASLADGRWDAAWLGLVAPVAGMLLAVDAYRGLTGRSQVACAKIAHNLGGRCIFRCQHPNQARVLALMQMDRQLHTRRP